jgi:hypothetical protein
MEETIEEAAAIEETPLYKMSIAGQWFEFGESRGKLVVQDEEFKYICTGEFDAAAARSMTNNILHHFEGSHYLFPDGLLGSDKDDVRLADIKRYIDSQRADNSEWIGSDMYKQITRIETRPSENFGKASWNAGNTPDMSGNNIFTPATAGKELFVMDEFTKVAKKIMREITPKEKSPEAGLKTAFLDAVRQKKAVNEALLNGSLACLPNYGPEYEGLTDTEPAINFADKTYYSGTNQLYLKDFQKRNGFLTAEYLTAEVVEKSGIPVREGQNGVWINARTRNEQTQVWEQKRVQVFNVYQTEDPNKVRDFAETTMREPERKRQRFLNRHMEGAYIECSSTDPEKYLGQYFAAVALGGDFVPSREQAAEFVQKMNAALNERTNGHTNPFKLAKICNAANEHCRNIIREEVTPAPSPEQKQEIKRGRSM